MARKDPYYLFNGHGRSFPDEHFDPFQLDKGIRIEMEHTGDARVAKIIAKDHLMEHPYYYWYLEKIEKEMEEDMKYRRGSMLFPRHG